MPVYEFRCPRCGPFDLRRGLQDPTDAASCPSCAEPARRVYTAPGGTLPRGPLRSAGQADRARFDRSRSGEPVVTGPPSGRRLPRPTGHSH